jgi:hypothetical protein
VRQGWDRLRNSLLENEFCVAGKSRVLMARAGVSTWWMTREISRDKLPSLLPEGQHDPTGNADRLIDGYLSHCWVPTDLAVKWLGTHDIQLPDNLLPSAPAPVPHKAAEPSPVNDAAALPDSRPKPTNPAVRRWFRDRVSTWPDDQPAPTEAEDQRAIRQHFAPGLTRTEFRTARKQDTPAAWRRQGRRVPWGVARNSAD